MAPIARALGVAAFTLALGVGAASAQEAAGQDACVAQLRKVGGPDARNGIVILDSQWSQAGTIVMMRDAGNSVWRCIGYEDGTVGELAVVDAADDSVNTAREGAEDDGTTTTERVHFAKGTTGASYRGTLTRGSSIRYVLNARKNQFLDVTVMPGSGAVSYQIFNPDQSFLLDLMSPSRPYRGQLWQSGDHVVEVVNREDGTSTFSIDLRIE